MKNLIIIPPDRYCGSGMLVKMNVSPEEFEKIRLNLTLELNERNCFKGFRVNISREEHLGELSGEPDCDGMWEYWLSVEKKKEADKLLP